MHAWEAVVFDSPDAGADLVIDWCPAEQVCASCGEAKDRSEGSWMRICPDCGLPLQVSGGDELDVLELSFEVDEEGDSAVESGTSGGDVVNAREPI